MTTPYSNRPKITQTDILNGYVTRYFVRNVSTKTVTEVDKKQYEAFKNSVLYEKLELQWRITGFANNILATDNNIIYGTKHSNTVTTQFYEKRLPGLQRILRNPLEYFQGTMNREADTPINEPKYSSTLGGSVALGRTFGSEVVPPPNTSTTPVNPPVVVPSTLTLSPALVNFAFTQSASVPSTQYVIVTEASGSAVTGLTIQSQSSWVSASLNTTSTPASMSVIITTTNLATGSYTSSITVSSSISAISSTVVLPVTASVVEAIIQPEYWWRADSGLTTSGWTAYNGGLDFTFTNVTTASSAVGAVFNGTNGFGQTPFLANNIAATHVLLRLDSIAAGEFDTMMGGTQNNIHQIAHTASGFWSIVDATAASTRYGVRTNTNIRSPAPKLLWFDFENGTNAVNVYTDNNSSVKASMATYTGTFNNLFTWVSGSRILLSRRQQTTGPIIGVTYGYMRMNVKELAIFTSSLSYEQGNAVRTQMLERWP